MGAATSETQNALRVSVCRNTRKIREAVRRIRQSEQSRAVLEWGERRASWRIPVETAVYLTPVVVEGNHLEMSRRDSSIIAYTKDISVAGVGFTHDEPLQTQHAVVTFDLFDEQPLSLLMEITWSRYDSEYPYLSSYVSGGKFLAVTETPEDVRCSHPVDSDL